MRPQFDPILLNEPVPVNGRIHKSVLDKPGFGVELNRDCNLKRPTATNHSGRCCDNGNAHIF